MIELADFREKTLRRAKTPEDFRLYKAGLEWDLTEPIVLENADDFKSAPRWKDRLTPFYHQVTNLITFCRRLPVTLLADDVGLGKTISAGLVISELAARGRLSKVLVVCPKILGPQWQSELVSKFDIPARFVIGRDLIEADFEELGVVITTYNSARLYLDKIPEDRFQMLVLDEAHKLRNLYGTEKPPKVATCFRESLQKRRFRFVLMLTATPIHNRLWDLYSLVDLLTVARGHQNPFGSEGAFARKFIADDRETARYLKPGSIEEFRSIVYGYMSRVRRGDARLHFPERLVKRRQVDPTPAELELIKTIAEPIQKLNRLVQISILKALASSPDALNSQLKNMARNGTIPVALSRTVDAIVTTMPLTAKLRGLGQLIDELKNQNPDRWRLVVFTALRETQTTIQNYLENYGLKVGIINGDSGARNQQTISRFKATPPEYRVIVSTEAGAEGVNLQMANVLVNFDLPWNPMIVEQRIGRIQRLGSDYQNVVVYNLTLRGTFEDYIVGRLIEKLQMASDAIGDIDSLLQNADGSDDDVDEKFEDRLLQLVLSALASKDKKRAAELEVASIETAIQTLEKEKENIDSLLGEDGQGYLGPKAPDLPKITRSMGVQDFTLAALVAGGARVSPNPPDLFSVEENGGRYYIRFAESSGANVKSVLYNEGASAFQRLVDRVIVTGLHNVDDSDREPEEKNSATIQQWIEKFGGQMEGVIIEKVARRFEGKALVRVRATVVHDSYERLIQVECLPKHHIQWDGAPSLKNLQSTVSKPSEAGIDVGKLVEAANEDEAIAEFSRFYLERREHEVACAGSDERKRKKLYDEFTPRFEASVVALDGQVRREMRARAKFVIDDSPQYEVTISTIPSVGDLVDAPPLVECSKSGRLVPRVCLAKCQASGALVLRHLLMKSELSGREALSEYIGICSVTGKHVITDELAVSDVSGKPVIRGFLLKSQISAKSGELEYFSTCSFTGAKALKSELAVSELSGALYRSDQELKSVLSGRKGHRSEFLNCHETGHLLAKIEAERCQQTGKFVRPGLLVVCEESGKRVLASECARCSVTNKLVLKRLLVVSSISGQCVLPSAAVRSSSGTFCLLAEAEPCAWTEKKYHPGDLGICTLTALKVGREFLTAQDSRLKPLFELLNDVTATAGDREFPVLEAALSGVLEGRKSRIVSGAISQAGSAMAICAELKSYFGLKKSYVGCVFSPKTRSIMGKVAIGKRTKQGWLESST